MCSKHTINQKVKESVTRGVMIRCSSMDCLPVRVADIHANSRPKPTNRVRLESPHSKKLSTTTDTHTHSNSVSSKTQYNNSNHDN